MKTVVRNLLSTVLARFYISIETTEEEFKLFFITDQGQDTFEYLKAMISLEHTLSDLNLEYEKQRTRRFNNIYSVKIDNEIVKFNLDFKNNLDRSKMRTHW